MFLLQSPEDARQPVANYLVLARGRDLSCSNNAVSAKNRKFSLPHSHLVLSFQATPFKFIKKALWFLKLEPSKQPMVKIWRSSLAPFLTNPPVSRKDEQMNRIAIAKTR